MIPPQDTARLSSTNRRQKIAGVGASRSSLLAELRLNRGMAGLKGRKHRTGVSDAVQLGARVMPQNKAKAAQIAQALGISVNAYLDALLEHEELDERGRPVWWDRPVPADQEELPLTQSA